MSGWIKIHRQLTEHWIWDKPNYLKWWLDILLEVNHSEQETIIKGTVLKCDRGEKLYSLETWAKRWNTNRSKVNRFFKLLEKEKMIMLKNETVTTRLTVCKYDTYQDNDKKSETQVKRKWNASETQVNTIKECKKEKNEIYYTEKEFLNNWNEARKYYLKKESNMNKLTVKEQMDFRTALKDFSKAEVQDAIHGLFKQEKIGLDVMILRPKHFLENISVYLEAEKTKSYKLYGSKPIEY